MIGFLKGYYGYKNFGDEVLLLGVIPYIFNHYAIDGLLIEADDVNWLKQRLARHNSILGDCFNTITVIPKHSSWKWKRDVLFLGGGEVLTDGRRFPHNGRNYFLYRKTLLFGSFHLLGGIGTPQSKRSQFLRRVLLGRAISVVTREKRSYSIALSYRKKQKTVLYHDFAEDVLVPLINNITQQNKKSTVLLNVNPYIWNENTKSKLLEFGKQYDKQLYFPAEIGVDDCYYNELKPKLTNSVLYDRTYYDLKTTLENISSCSQVVAARLHVLWLAKLLTIPYEPLVYQEKIKTFLENA